MRYFILSVLVLSVSLVYSQINADGIPLIKQYTDADYGDAGQIWAIAQDSRGVMYFGSNYGLMEYNGAEWKLYGIENSTAVRSLAVSDNDILFYGSTDDFGMLMYDNKGNKKTISLHRLYENKIDIRDVWKTHVIGQKVYFQTFDKLFEFDFSGNITDTANVKKRFKVWTPDDKVFHLSFVVRDKLYILDKTSGLKVLNNDKLELLKDGDFFASKKIYTILSYDNSRLLIGTRSGFYIYNPNADTPIKPFEFADNIYNDGMLLYNGTLLPDSKMAFGTLLGGCFVIDKLGNVVERYYDQSGLAGNAVLSLYINTDKNSNGNLWISTHQNGIYRLGYNNGFRQWNETNGINSPVTDIIAFNNMTYIATMDGIFCLKADPETQLVKYSPLLPVPAWDLSLFQLPNGKSKLLAATIKGVFEITKENETLPLIDGYTKSLFQLNSDKNKLIIGYNAGYGIADYDSVTQQFNLNFREDSIVSSDIVSVNQDRRNNALWLGTNSSGFLLIPEITKPKHLIPVDSVNGIPLIGQRYSIYSDKDNFLLYCGTGIYKYDYENNKATLSDIYKQLFSGADLGFYQIIKNHKEYRLAAYSYNLERSSWAGVINITQKDTTFYKDSLFAQTIPQKPAYALFQQAYKLWIANSQGVYTYDVTNKRPDSLTFHTIITQVKTANDSILFNGSYFKNVNDYKIISLNQPENLMPVLEFKSNEIELKYAAPFFDHEERTLYSYRLLGDNDSWSKWKTLKSIRFTNLREGEYDFQVRAKNIYNQISPVASYKFEILPPWYRTTWAIILFVILGILLIGLIIKLYTRKLVKEKERLEELVNERTKEIQQKNIALQQSKEEIEAQRDEIEAQRDRVMKQRDEIEEQQKSIMDSIRYASRIQGALLPPDEFLQKHLPEYFVLFRPRDVVSGDFYWAAQDNNCVWVVAADCTGHGVPGAFMSMLGMSFLNEIVVQKKIQEPHLILNHLRAGIKRSLRQTGKDKEAKDGMDLALCKIDFDNMKAEFSGAYNPLYQLRDGKIIRHKADRMPIGIYIKEKESFTKHEIDLQKGDRLYMFSDGYVDQFGGEKNQKVRSAKFKELLIESADKSMAEQREVLNTFIEEWMNYPDKSGQKQEQIDDILVIGIEIK